ncbi:unnamed protein product [Sphagnum balticum]
MHRADGESGVMGLSVPEGRRAGARGTLLDNSQREEPRLSLPQVFHQLDDSHREGQGEAQDEEAAEDDDERGVAAVRGHAGDLGVAEGAQVGAFGEGRCKGGGAQHRGLLGLYYSGQTGGVVAGARHLPRSHK